MARHDNKVFVEIKGYEGLYAISQAGEVLSIRRNSLMRPVKIGTGYFRVELSKEGVRKTFLIHRLVAETFIPNPDAKEQVNHINENKADNRVENLEWATAKENSNHGTRTARSAANKCIPIVAKNLNTGEVIEFPSAVEASKYTGALRPNISKCCDGERQSSQGWSFSKKGVS